MKKYVTLLTLSALCSNGITPAFADKGVQIWGGNQGHSVNLTFEWNNNKQSVETPPNTLLGENCWSNITGTLDKDFNIVVNNGSDLADLAAKLSPVDGHTTMTGVSGSSLPNRDVGNIWPTTGSSTYQGSLFLSGDTVFVNFGMYSAYKKDKTPISGHDQAYAYVTPNTTKWMGDARGIDTSTWDAAKITDLVLPGAHDAGMFTLAGPINDVNKLAGYMSSILSWISFIPGISKLLGYAEDDVFYAIQNFSLTQKDPTATALKAGIRYFDYRPATVLGNTGFDFTTYYHVHNFIPGYEFASFLGDVGKFLTDSGNEHEIVIVNIKDSGILGTSGNEGSGSGNLLFQPMYQVASDLTQASKTITKLLGDTYPDLSPIYSNDFSDFSGKTLGELYSANQRLIFYFGTGYIDSYPATDASTYYGTFDPSNVKAALNTALKTCQAGTTDYAVFQLQDTVTDYLVNNIGETHDEIQQAILSMNGSPLMSTKGMFDNTTYKWAVQYINSCETMSVMLNDFAGNLLAFNAQQLTKNRIQGSNYVVPQRQDCDTSKLDQ